MIRKENKNPNNSRMEITQSRHSASQNSKIKHAPPGIQTPDAATSRSIFKPKFIIKESLKDSLAPKNDTFLNSPESFTEKNTLQIEQIFLQPRRECKPESQDTLELERRTTKFKQIIGLCCSILGTVKQTNENTHISNMKKIENCSQKIEEMLQLFEMFTMGLQE